MRYPDTVSHPHVKSTDAQGVSRSLFTVPPSRSQLDTLFRQEKQQSENDFKQRWNFDVSKEQPVPGRWKYDPGQQSPD